MDSVEEALKEQAEYRKQLLGMQESQPHLFKSVLLDGAREPDVVTRFYIEKVDGVRVIRMLPEKYPI